jgi:hypothetical protein
MAEQKRIKKRISRKLKPKRILKSKKSDNAFFMAEKYGLTD